MKIKLLATSLFIVPIFACSDSGGGGGSANGGGSPATGTLVINEIQARGAEWVEVANSSSDPLDVGGLGICDEDANGDCEAASAMRFPEGTKVPGKGHVVVLLDKLPADGVGPHKTCELVGVDECFFATWRVSAVDGETVRIVDAKNAEISALTYPPNATVDDTTSWGRLPDITGEAKLGKPTPGAENASP